MSQIIDVVKPPQWGPICRALVAPEWQRFWDGLVACIPFFEGGGNPRDIISGKELVVLNYTPFWGASEYGIVGRTDNDSWELQNFSGVTARPFSLAVFTANLGAGGLQGVLDLGSSVAHNNAVVGFNLTSPIVATYAHRPPGPGISYANGTSEIGTAYHLIGGVEHADGASRDVYVNGVKEATNTTNLSGYGVSVNRIVVGQLGDNSPSNYADDACIAVGYVWNREVLAPDWQHLAQDPFGPVRMDRRVLVAVPAAGSIEATPGISAVTVTGYAPTVSTTAHVTVTPGLSQESITGYAPTITTSDHQTVTPGVSQEAITGYAPTVTATEHVTVTPGVSQASITGYAPTVSVTEHVTVTPGLSQASITGYTPTVTTTAHVTTTPGISQTILTGYAPIVTATGAVTVTPGVSAPSITCYAPSVTTTEHVSVTPGPSQVAFTGLAPTVTTSAHVTATPGVAQIVFTGYAPSPTVSGGDVTVTPGVSALSLAGYAPTANVALGPRVTVSVPAQSRSLAVASQARSLSVASQSRTLIIPDQDEGA